MPSDDPSLRLAPGAILGARRSERSRTCPIVGGRAEASVSGKTTDRDALGRIADDYGSEGWEFESLRVRHSHHLVTGRSAGDLLLRSQLSANTRAGWWVHALASSKSRVLGHLSRGDSLRP